MTRLLHKAPALLAACLALALPPFTANGAGVGAPDPGRLFYTPAERAKLEAARAQEVASAGGRATGPADRSVRYDGVLIRSDGRTMHWADGKAIDAPRVQGLKPGQIRSEGKVYEPYEILSPAPLQESAP